ncbi:hypothetical protein SCG7086_AB_00180 [Chlamydiales bacterium SCGC AG-110-P3]|nr:hypothetical protein SCG7086_AB_00180 [Chlamydiales bacterium SCGC AG-110-P3]
MRRNFLPRTVFVRKTLLALIGWVVLLAHCAAVETVSSSSSTVPGMFSQFPQGELQCEWALSPLDAVYITLDSHRAIKIAQLQVIQQEGTVCEQSGPFDPQLDGSVEHHIQDNFRSSGGPTGLTGHRSIVNAGVTKTTRYGTRFSAQYSVDHIDNALQIAPFTSRAGSTQITFQIDQPLLRGRRCGIDTANERASQWELEAANAAHLQTVAERLNRTVLAYWAAAAAQAQLRVERESEKRLQVLVENTQDLINLNYLASSDIEQPKAQLARQRSRRIISEQSFFSSVQAMTISMGFIDAVFIQDESLIIFSEFPVIDSSAIEDPNAINTLVGEMLPCRHDIRELVLLERAAETLAAGACNDRKTQLDVFGSAGLVDDKFGLRVNHIGDAAKINNPQRDYRVGVTFSRPLFNRGRNGVAKRREAEYEAAILATEDLRVDAIGEIRELWTNQLALAFEAEHLGTSATHWRSLMENEYTKLKAGMSTLFTLIDFEEQLTATLRSYIDLQRQYAQNIVALRLAVGALVTADAGLDCYRICDVTTLPIGDSE